MTNTKSSRLFCTVLLFFILVPVWVLIHEIGHTLVALLLGIPFKDLTFGWYGLGPGVTLPDYFPIEHLPLFRYAGGLFAGILLLATYCVYVFLHHREYAKFQWWKQTKWWADGFLVIWGGYQVFNGYLEGAHFQDYVAGNVPSQLQILAAFMGGLVIHSLVTLLLTKSNRVEALK